MYFSNKKLIFDLRAYPTQLLLGAVNVVIFVKMK